MLVFSDANISNKTLILVCALEISYSWVKWYEVTLTHYRLRLKDSNFDRIFRQVRPTISKKADVRTEIVILNILHLEK